jgi:RND superfamily putative drug exporter
MSNHQLHNSRPLIARTIRRLSVPIVLAWLAITVLMTVGVPSLEQVERERAVSLTPSGAPSFEAADHMVRDFKEANSDTAVMVVLEGQQPLGDAAHKYYNRLIRQFEDDQKHVQHIQNFWGDPLTAGAAQSADGKAAYVQLDLSGRLGAAQANESAEAIRDIVARTPPPPGVKAYVTGAAAITSDMARSGERTVLLVTLVSLAVIFIMLLLVYRSLITVILLLLMVWIELQVARGIIAFLGHHELIGLSTYVVNLLVAIVIAAGTDYAIFFTGRYQEARQAGEDRETATTPLIEGSRASFWLPG